MTGSRVQVARHDFLVPSDSGTTRSGSDFWSRPDDLIDLQHDAISAQSVRAVTIPEATHYVHLDRPECGRDVLLKEVTEFFA